MRRILFAWLIAFTPGLRAADGQPATNPTPATGSDAAQLQRNESTAAVPGHRLMSPETAEKLAAAAPKYTPPAPPPATAPAESSPIVREVEKPQNQIVRLPSVIVGEQRQNIPESELKVLTPKGRADYAMNRRPGLRLGPFPSLNKRIALQMLDDDLESQRRAEEYELASLYAVK